MSIEDRYYDNLEFILENININEELDEVLDNIGMTKEEYNLPISHQSIPNKSISLERAEELTANMTIYIEQYILSERRRPSNGEGDIM